MFHKKKNKNYLLQNRNEVMIYLLYNKLNCSIVTV